MKKHLTFCTPVCLDHDSHDGETKIADEFLELIFMLDYGGLEPIFKDRITQAPGINRATAALSGPRKNSTPNISFILFEDYGQHGFTPNDSII